MKAKCFFNRLEREFRHLLNFITRSARSRRCRRRFFSPPCEAHGYGARFWACPANLALFDMTEADLVPECRGLMAAAAMLQNVMSDDTRVLPY